jgi:N-methylhydantoinase B
MNFLNPEAENRMLDSKVTMTIRRGDVFRHEVAGAGGWGDPLEREPAAVLKDVRNELMSLEHAADAYGVVIDPVTWRVEVSATDRLRTEMRAARGWTETPQVLWEEPSSRPSESAA